MMSKISTQPAPHEQYLTLYTQNRDTLFGSTPEVLNKYRDQAYETLSRSGFPPYKSEDYKRINLPAEFGKEYGVNIRRISFPIRKEPQYSCHLLPNELAAKSSVVNDCYFDTLFENAKRNLPPAVFMGGMAEFVQTYPQIAQDYYASAATVNKSGYVAFNTLLVQDVFVLYIPRGVKVTRPIHLLQLLRADVDLLTCRRWLIILEDEAEASLLVCDHTMDSVHFLVSQVAEIFVGKGASLVLNDLEENSRNVVRLSDVFVKQEARSQVTINHLTLNNGISRNNITATQQGEEASITLGGLGIGSDAQQIDNQVRVEHMVPNCSSFQLFKNILNHQASGSFAGRIYIAPGAQEIEAFQNNHNLLLSPTAKIYSKPQLEIYADDVKCTHGLTTGQIDTDALFYLQQRGIPEEQARIMLSVAFADDVIKLLPETLQDRVHSIVEARIAGNEVKYCGNCNKLIF